MPRQIPWSINEIFDPDSLFDDDFPLDGMEKDIFASEEEPDLWRHRV